MSSEPAGKPHRFRMTAAGTITTMFLAVIGLTVANASQGPHLTGAEINPQAAIQRSGQRLILRFDQPVVAVTAAAVTITPAVPVTVKSDRGTLTVRFGTTLRYATTYEIAARVRGTTTGAASNLAYSFQTPKAEVYLLQRAGAGAALGTPDRIIRTSVGSTIQELVRSGPRIQEYAVADPAIAVVTQNAIQGGSLTVGPVSGSGPTRTIADHSDISQLQSSGPGGLFGFVRTPLTGPNRNIRQLQLYDPVSGGNLIGVLGFDGKPLDAQDWAFVPGTTSIVAQTADASFFLIDPLNGAATQPLGGHLTMDGFVPGTTTLIVEDPGHHTAIDLATGVSSTLPAINLPEAETLYKLFPLAGNRRYAGLVLTYAEPNSRYAVVAIGTGVIRPLYAPKPVTATIGAVCPSPNDEYLAVETSPGDAVSDEYDFAPGLTNTTTVFVDTVTGRTDGTAAGFAVDWCN